MTEYDGHEKRHTNRRGFGGLSDHEIDAIATRAKEKALEQVYADIGKGVFKRILWLLGLAGSAALAYFGFKTGT